MSQFTAAVLISALGTTGLRFFALPINLSLERKGFQVALFVASREGATLDTDLLNGGGADDTTAIQALLDQARGGAPVHVVVDGPARVSGLDVYANTTLEFTAGAGLFLAAGSDRAMIRNAHRTRDEVADSHVVLRGGFLNGNREGQEKRGSANLDGFVDKVANFTPGLEFLGVRHLTVEGTTVYNCRSFAIWIANASFIRLKSLFVDANLPPYPGTAPYAEQRAYLEAHRSNLDGIHLNGPIDHLEIESVRLRTEDDAIALNANDAASDDLRADDLMGPYVGQGPITDVRIRGVEFLDCLQGFRLLSSGELIDRVIVSDVFGAVRHRVVVASSWWSKGTGNVGAITFSDLNISALPSASFAEIYADRYEEVKAGSYDVGEEADLALFSLNSRIAEIALENVAVAISTPRPVIRVGRNAEVENLVGDIRVQDATGQADPYRVVPGGRVARGQLTLNWSP